MELEAFARRYCAMRDTSASTERQYLAHVRGLVAAAGRPLAVVDLTDDLVAQHLRALRLAGKSDSYRRSRRSHLLAIWRAACEDPQLEQKPKPPGKIPTVRIRDYTPRAYRLSDVGLLLLGCQFHPRGDFWRAYVRLAWESGLAPCDLLALPRALIGDDCWCSTTRRKTGARVTFRLRPNTVAAIDAICTDLCLPWGKTMEALRQDFARLRAMVGLKGSLKWLRSGSGCDVEYQRPGAGSMHLGNTPAIFNANYRVDAIVMPEMPMPREPESAC